MLKSKVLFFVTGSIAAFKAAQVVSRLVQDGCEVQVIATPSALKFVGAATFEGLTGKKILSDLWEDGRAMDHIHLSRWADFGVVCPASANTIARMALGLGDDVAGACWLAWPKGKPLHVFPAMNPEMLGAAPVQQHLAALSARGILVAPTAAGNLACGETGSGRLLEPEQILEILRNTEVLSEHERYRVLFSDAALPKKEPGASTNAVPPKKEPGTLNSAQSGSGLSNAPATKTGPGPSFRSGCVKRILITGGATRENIDGIRFISNVSTGRTAAELCDRFSLAGWDVTYVHGQQAAQPEASVRRIAFTDIKSLDEALRSELAGDYSAVIHCAAVSDYTVDTVGGETPDRARKITSGGAMTIKLKPTAKILPNLKEYSRNKAFVIGFKLTLNADERATAEAVEKVFSSGVDTVVANDWSRINAAEGIHPGFVQTRSAKQEFSDVAGMAAILIELLSAKETV